MDSFKPINFSKIIVTLDPIQILSSARDALVKAGEPAYREFLYSKAMAANPWFTTNEIERARLGWIEALEGHSAAHWIDGVGWASEPRRVGLVLAGNIPWVGLHDVLSVLITGHKAEVKCSSDDFVLMSFVIEHLRASTHVPQGHLEVVERLKAPEAVVATGSNNSSRYFQHYFAHIPHLIRKSRTSVAVIGKSCRDEDLMQLSDDVFSYFGLGCRNVRHLMLEEGFNIELLLEIWRERAYDCMLHAKYANNFDFQLALHMMNRVPHQFVPGIILRRDDALFSALSVVTWQYFSGQSAVMNRLHAIREQWQCVVGPAKLLDGVVPYGQSQRPALWDYADGVNTLDFLQSIG
jgi:hypothetical protein